MRFKLKPGHGRSDVGSIVLDPDESPEYETWDADEIVNLRAVPFVDEVEERVADVIALLPDLDLRQVKNVRAFDSRPTVVAAAEQELAARHQALLAEQAQEELRSEPERLAARRAALEAELAAIAEREEELAVDEDVDAAEGDD